MSDPDVKIHDATQNPAAACPCPKHLTGDARRLWKQLAPSLASADGLAPGTAAGLEIACQSFADWRAYSAKIVEQGAVVRSPSGFAVINPAVGLAAKSAETWRKLAKQLGIDRPQSAGKGTRPQSKLGAILKGPAQRA